MTFTTNSRRKNPPRKPVNLVDSYFLLAEAIVDLLRYDSNKKIPCETLDNHSVKVCARSILMALNQFIETTPNLDAVDIAMEVMRLHNTDG